MGIDFLYVYVYYTYMGNKTIYVSEKDEPLFEKAKEIAGEALSTVIARALREFVTRNSKKQDEMKEIALKVGSHNSEREQRFVGIKLGVWEGFSDDKQWWMNAVIYQTQKKNIAILLNTISKASLLTDSKAWKYNGDYLINSQTSELLVEKHSDQFENKIPTSLYKTLKELIARYEVPVEYLDI